MDYNDPDGGAPSSIGGDQLNPFYYKRAALVEAQRDQYFLPMANVDNQPKHMGKTMKCYHYLPLLSDGNINSEGIDTEAVILLNEEMLKTTIVITDSATTSTGNGYVSYYAVGEGVDTAAALADAKASAVSIFKDLGVFVTSYDATVTALLARPEPWTVVVNNEVPSTGNLYGSSKDAGAIVSKLPAIGENGGRYNRVSFTRVDIEGSMDNFGIFSEYTQDSVQFDSDEEIESRVHRELTIGASDVTEAALQIDITNSAGIVRFGGVATQTSEITGEATDTSLITYDDLVRMSIDLDNNRCPKKTTMITGTLYTDTKTIDAARPLYIGSELISVFRNMMDVHDDKVFVPVQQYAAGGNTMRGEIGAVDQFRIVVVPEMQHWAGEGATVTTNDGYHETNGKYDVFPMLCIGEDSFSTIGFQTDGKTIKFDIKHVKPGSELSYAQDPYGKKGFTSIQWWYGFLLKRPERIALAKTVAPY